MLVGLGVRWVGREAAAGPAIRLIFLSLLQRWHRRQQYRGNCQAGVQPVATCHQRLQHRPDQTGVRFESAASSRSAGGDQRGCRQSQFAARGNTLFASFVGRSSEGLSRPDQSTWHNINSQQKFYTEDADAYEQFAQHLSQLRADRTCQTDGRPITPAPATIRARARACCSTP